ncbi:hypothetical protein EDB19DRAFT_1750679 [Suillus lakei]|nr:hypothetical protein EDB19DRAFT_1750679 [Suillus lakei]
MSAARNKLGYIFSDHEDVIRLVSKVMPLVASFQVFPYTSKSRAHQTTMFMHMNLLREPHSIHQPNLENFHLEIGLCNGSKYARYHDDLAGILNPQQSVVNSFFVVLISNVMTHTGDTAMIFPVGRLSVLCVMSSGCQHLSCTA